MIITLLILFALPFVVGYAKTSKEPEWVQWAAPDWP